MKCEEALARSAELGDASTTDADAAAHVAACPACRAALDEARETVASLASFESADGDGSLPSADADAAWRAAQSPAVRPMRSRLLTTTKRVAAVLLASIGVLALLGAKAESSDGRTTLVLTLPWTGADAPSGNATGDAAAARDAALARAVRDELGPQIDSVIRRIDASDKAHARAVGDVADLLAARSDEDVRILVDEIVALRRELAAVRRFQASMVDATAMPSLPDPR